MNISDCGAPLSFSRIFSSHFNRGNFRAFAVLFATKAHVANVSVHPEATDLLLVLIWPGGGWPIHLAKLMYSYISLGIQVPSQKLFGVAVEGPSAF